jgi:transcriptional regulator with XRE-family HTH domain
MNPDRPERTTLIRARELLGLTRPELAKRVGITREFVYCVESGQRDPSLPTMQRWVKALGQFGTMDLFRDPKKPRRQLRGFASIDEPAA